MTYSENLPQDNSKTSLSADELREILRNPRTPFVKEDYGTATILIDNYIIEDEYLILDDSITIDLPITFQNCIFKSKYHFFIDGLICNEGLTIFNCTITDKIYFNTGIFKKDVILKSLDVKSIHLSRCTFDKISIIGNDINQIWVSDTKFESLLIDAFPISANINNLVIFASEETGHITVKDLSFNSISLYGINKGKELNFSRIKSNNISITRFKNEGSLNFYGIEPKDISNDEKYIQIIDSNLNKAQFYRAYFSQYKELIIIDSFVTDCLFIGCKWSSNIRALYGPGYPTFKESLNSGRKTNAKEIVAIEEAYRQLKISMSQHSDKIQEHKFYSEELNFHNKSLSWEMPWRNQFWDKSILIWSKLFSDYGKSFIKPLFWLIFGHYILFLIALLFDGYYPLHISFSNPTTTGFREAFELFFLYINPLRKFETSFSGYLILLDLIMRIWSSYMIYNLIRASRRFIS